MQAISLFSGCGGMDYGLEQAGIETVLQAEIDPWCLQVLERHWPNVERVNDVRDVVRAKPAQRGACHASDGASEGAAWDEESDLSLVHFGSPCQDLSVAGKRGGLAGERSGLFYEAVRAIREFRPAFALWENVPGALSSHGGRDFACVLQSLADAGAVDIAWRVLDAQWFGVPQRRRRIFLVADFRGQRAASVLFEPEGGAGHPPQGGKAGTGVAYALTASVRKTGDGHGNAWNSNYLAETLHTAGHKLEWPGNYVANAIQQSGPPGTRRDDEARLVIAGTLAMSGKGHRGHQISAEDSAGGHLPVTAQGVRRLTPRECERLQGLPDDWTRWTADGREIPDSHRYRMVGNSVAAPVLTWIGKRLVEAMKGGAHVSPQPIG